MCYIYYIIKNNTLKPHHMENFEKTLKGINRILYKSSYEFHLQHVPGATLESAHIEGLDKIKKVEILREKLENDVYIDLSTGKKVNFKNN